jgi:uncharacterized protein with PIN domain
MRRALRSGALVRGGSTEEQLADVLDRFRPALRPLTRCTACGGELEQVAKESVADSLPEGTRRTYDDFARCPACGRVYWAGAHHHRIQALVRRAQQGSRLDGTTEHTQQGSASALRVRDPADPRT